jgi:hypothetical protein
MKLGKFTKGEPTSVDQRARNNVRKYFSDERVWFERARKIGALNDKELVMIKGERVELAQLRVETAPPNSPERGKVCIAAWDRTPDEPREHINLTRAKALKYVGTDKNRRRRFLTRNALDSIRSHTSQLGNVQLELVFGGDEESLCP